MTEFKYKRGSRVTTLPRKKVALCCAGKIADSRMTSVGAEYQVEGSPHWHRESEVFLAERGEDSATAEADRANNEPK